MQDAIGMDFSFVSDLELGNVCRTNLEMSAVCTHLMDTVANCNLGWGRLLIS